MFTLGRYRVGHNRAYRSRACRYPGYLRFPRYLYRVFLQSRSLACPYSLRPACPACPEFLRSLHRLFPAFPHSLYPPFPRFRYRMASVWEGQCPPLDLFTYLSRKLSILRLCHQLPCHRRVSQYCRSRAYRRSPRPHCTLQASALDLHPWSLSPPLQHQQRQHQCSKPRRHRLNFPNQVHQNSHGRSRHQSPARLYYQQHLTRRPRSCRT